LNAQWQRKNLSSCPKILDHYTYVERYNRTVRYDWLAHHLFETLHEIQEFATR